MGNVYPQLNDRLRSFIASQQMFFVATAPLAAEGHINLSPKGLDSFRILDDQTVAYLDLVGSGIETVAHLRENGRIVIMFCAFAGARESCGSTAAAARSSRPTPTGRPPSPPSPNVPAFAP